MSIRRPEYDAMIKSGVSRDDALRHMVEHNTKKRVKAPPVVEAAPVPAPVTLPQIRGGGGVPNFSNPPAEIDWARSAASNARLSAAQLSPHGQGSQGSGPLRWDAVAGRMVPASELGRFNPSVGMSYGAPPP
jgi:hypothetical protein